MSYSIMKESTQSIKTSSAYNISDEQLFKFISTPTKNNFTQRFGDPNPLAFISFILILMPSVVCLTQWGSLTPSSLIGICGQFYLSGGLGAWVAAIMCFVKGMTFQMIAYASYGSFCFGFGFLLHPKNAILLAFGGNPTSPEFLQVLGVYLLSFAFWNFLTAIIAIRIGLADFLIFFTVFLGMTFIAAGAFRMQYDKSQANNLIKTGGYALAITCVDGLYIIFDQVAASVGVQRKLPKGKWIGRWTQKF